jgi:hypothetical protein
MLTILSTSSCHCRNWQCNSKHYRPTHLSSGGSCSSTQSGLLDTSFSHLSFSPPLYCSFFGFSSVTVFTYESGSVQMETSLGSRFATLFSLADMTMVKFRRCSDAQLHFCFLCLSILFVLLLSNLSLELTVFR